ncbi:hypothetical protein [Gordonia sp. OPL2]|uniref:hypothetical protein n=1 Tax=Gordonia sp. OPL2 TaxID=2486274 RepID=UPI0016556D6E|nr:hypothetical protein [Gordonia sp. OPL2]ROZ89439.1 hypothetical protein EEB19_17380 [Gordonia sp. OPL2]
MPQNPPTVSRNPPIVSRISRHRVQWIADCVQFRPEDRSGRHRPAGHRHASRTASGPLDDILDTLGGFLDTLGDILGTIGEILGTVGEFGFRSA